MKNRKIVIGISAVAAVVLITIGSIMLFSGSHEKQSFTAKSASVEFSAEEKAAFAAWSEVQYEKALQAGRIKAASEEEVDLWMRETVFGSGEERRKAQEKLEEQGVYLLELKPVAEMLTAEEGAGNVELTEPVIFYRADTETWTVAFGGSWQNDRWAEGVSVGEIGFREDFGVRYRDISEDYRSSVTGCFAELIDKNGEESVATHNRSDGNGAEGFTFSLQDYSYLEGLFWVKYVGEQWYGSCTYDKEFESFEGIAQAFYTHTW